MAPRHGKRKSRARNPIPVWLPLPRPCLRSLNLPGPPYYMPMSPEMYLPPYCLLPPSYFTKPICHCANEDFCTTSNCQDSTECHKMQPMFCPHGAKREESLDTQGYRIREQQENNDYEEISSNSDTNICSSCGAPKLKTSNTKNKLRQDDQPSPCHTFKLRQTKGSFASSTLQNLQGEQDSDKHIYSENNVARILPNNNKPEMLLSRKNSNCCANSFCQNSFSSSNTQEHSKLTTMRNDNLISLKTNKRSSGSTKGYAEDSESSPDRNIPTLSDNYKTPSNVTKSKIGCGSCAEPKNGSDVRYPVHSMPDGMQNANMGRIKKQSTDKIHIDQFPHQLSKARERRANKKSGCCYTGSDNIFKMKPATEIDKTNRPITDYKNKTKCSKGSECECHSTNIPSKASFKSSELPDCRCGSTNTPYKKTPGFHKVSKCECSSSKIPRKNKATSNKFAEGECCSTNITQKTSSRTRKVSDCSCSSTHISPKSSSRSHRLSENPLCSTDINPKPCSSTELTDQEASKSSTKIVNSSDTNVRESSCQCKFPPAYEHLSCSRNPHDNCSCTNNN